MTSDDMQDVLAGRARWAVVCADALEALKQLPDGCCDALLSDPPAAIAMMGMQWDHNKGGRDRWIAWLASIMAEARRCVRPGGYALVWALPRTSHWTAMALEDAGWTIRDSIAHLFGSGFPKSQSCLKPAHEVWWLAKAPGPLQPLQIDACRLPTGDGLGRPKGTHNAFPFSDDAWGNGHLTHTEGHSGGRWPPNTLLSHVPPGPDGTGGCQPAGMRSLKVAYSQPMERTTSHSNVVCYSPAAKEDKPVGYADAEGYEQVDAWTCVDGCPIKALDEQAGPRTSGKANANGHKRSQPPGTGIYGGGKGLWTEAGDAGQLYGDTGHASRFFPTFLGQDHEDAVPFRY